MMPMNDVTKQSVINIGTLGHIDHGKTSLVKALTNIWTDKHSESIKRNMTIILGYADAVIRKCENCEGPQAYTITEKCSGCSGPAKSVMRFSIVDAPGHENLMATAIAGANMINAILFVIAANEPCPMQQTKEHLMIINILGIKNVIIVQTKIDIVGKSATLEHYNQIKQFIKGSVIENAPIVPVMANKGINVDVVLELITKLERPKFDTEVEPFMYVIRSFDTNKPGAKVGNLLGGVVGGTLIRGRFGVHDEVEIRPGIGLGSSQKHTSYKSIITQITSISNGTEILEEACPGGLIGLSTELDPSFTKANGLMGNVAGHVGKLPDVMNSVEIAYNTLNRPDIQERGFAEDESVVLIAGTATVIGYVRKAKKNRLSVELNHPICIDKQTKIAVMRNVLHRWRLTGYAVLAS